MEILGAEKDVQWHNHYLVEVGELVFSLRNAQGWACRKIGCAKNFAVAELRSNAHLCEEHFATRFPDHQRALMQSILKGERP